MKNSRIVTPGTLPSIIKTFFMVGHDWTINHVDYACATSLTPRVYRDSYLKRNIRPLNGFCEDHLMLFYATLINYI